MNIAIIRRKFPEYGDLADADLMEVFGNLLNDIMTEPPPKYIEKVQVPGVEAEVSKVETAVNSLSDQIVKVIGKLSEVNASVKKLDKPDKEETDLSPHFIALGVQLSKIETAINRMCEMETEDSEDETETPEPRIKEFRIKRDELGGIDKVIPIYEA